VLVPERYVLAISAWLPACERVYRVIRTGEGAKPQAAWAKPKRAAGNLVVCERIEISGRRDSICGWACELSLLLGSNWAQVPRVLITGHRRENFGDGIEQICRAIATLADRTTQAPYLMSTLTRIVEVPGTRTLKPEMASSNVSYPL
jgi:hypothetical protein